jgi:hypothetical protein
MLSDTEASCLVIALLEKGEEAVQMDGVVEKKESVHP